MALEAEFGADLTHSSPLMKQSIPGLLLAGVLLLLSPHIAHSNASSRKIPFQIFRTQTKGISFSIDPRIELLQTVMLLAGNPQINPVDLDYKLAIARRFAAYRQHPLFGFIKKYGPEGKLFTSIDAPIWYTMHLTPDLEWRRDVGNSFRKEPLLDSLRILLRAFAKESHYADFFNSNAAFYRLSLSNLQFNLADQDEKARLLAYYGVRDGKQIQFNVILNFLGAGNFGPRLESPAGREFYAVISPNGSYDRIATFDHNELYGLIWHEFGHSFANPLVEENLAQFEALSALWEPIKASMESQAYGEWKAVVWEHLVNAVTCRLAASKYGEDYAEVNFVRPLLGKRWIYAVPLLAALKEYEANRASYPTLRSFTARILAAFGHIQPRDIEQWQEKTAQIRQPEVTALPLLGDIYGKENVLFILSTGEADQAGDARLKAFVKAHQAQDFPSATLVDDTAALRMDLSGYHLFVVGTPWGNRFLQRVMPQLPVRITAKEVIAGKKYEGTGYTFMSGWVNPGNPGKIMAIYTAQDPDDLVNFTWIPRGSTHYHLTKGFITLKAQDYQRRNLIWSCQ